MNGRVCDPPMPAVERDQLLERAALLGDRVVEAVDHDVGDVREAVGAEQVPRAFGEKPRSGSSPVTRPSESRRAPRGADRERAVGRASARAGTPMCGCERSAVDQSRVAAPRSPRASAGAGAPSGRSARGCPSRARSRRGPGRSACSRVRGLVVAAGRLVDGAARPGRVLVAGVDAVTPRPRQRALAPGPSSP